MEWVSGASGVMAMDVEKREREREKDSMMKHAMECNALKESCSSSLPSLRGAPLIPVCVCEWRELNKI